MLQLTLGRPLTLGVFNIRISALVRLKREAQARSLLAERLDELGTNPIDRPFLLSSLGRIANRTDDRKAALAWHRQAFEAALSLYGPENPNVLGFRNEYADVMRRNGLFEQALAEFDGIRELAVVQFKPDDPRFSALALNTAICEAKLGKLSASGRQRLELAASKGVNEVSLTAFVALLRDDYFNGRIRAFTARVSKLRAELGATPFTPELALWFAVHDRLDRSGAVWTQLIADATKFDPLLREKLSN